MNQKISMKNILLALYLASGISIGLTLPVQANNSVENSTSNIEAVVVDRDELVKVSKSQLSENRTTITRLMGYQHKDNKLFLTTEQGTISLEFVTENSVYVNYALNASQPLPSYLLDENHQSNIVTKLKQNEHSFTLTSGNASVVIDKSPIRLSFFHQNKLMLEEELGYFEQDATKGFRFKLRPEEKLFGGGQRVLGMDRRGHRLPLYNQAHYGYQDHSEQMYFGLPGVMSSDKYILMFDNSAKGYLDLGASQSGILQFDAQAGRTAYLVAMSDSYQSLINHYTHATGKQPMPPIWALGSMASRFGYRSEAQAREVVAEYQRQNMPLDAIIFDLYWFGAEVKGLMGNLDWDRTTFPTGEQMISDFKASGINTILISEPFILTTSNNWQAGAENQAFAVDNAGKPVTFDFYFGNGSLVDVFSKEGQDWFWSFYKKQLDWGVAGFWGDLGEPEVHPQHAIHQLSDTAQNAYADEIHNVYGHQWAKTLFNGFREEKPKQRPFIMMRSGFAGSQRYGMIPWTGDVSKSWSALNAQVELSLQMGLLGLGYTHSDLGGFVESEKFDEELYVRWLQFGAFQPVFRPHSQDATLPEPVFHGEEVSQLIKTALSWRYQLLPYNYSIAYQNHSQGTPLMRPRFFIDEANDENFLDTDAYLWGPNLLVVPVTKPGIKQLEYTFPKGVWFDYWHGQAYSAGKQVLPVNKETIPVFVKAGAIIPQAPNMLNTQAYTGNELIIHYWFDASAPQSSFQLYQDDGLSTQYLQGDFTQINFSAALNQEQVNFDINVDKGEVKLKENKQMKIVVHNASQLQNAYQGNKQLTSVYDSKLKTLTLDVTFTGSAMALTFKP